MKKLFFLTLPLLAAAVFAQAQNIKMPAPSPHQALKQDFALSYIAIDYSRPGVKGRTIFGDLVPYGKVWRTGANAVTTIEFGENVKVEGHDVPAGKYAVYTIPGENEWTIIFNNDVKNWGTEYKGGDDFLRFTVPSYQISEQVETFTIQVDSITNTSAVVYILWDHTYVPFRVTADIDSTVMAEIDKGMQGDKKPYFAAASYYFQTGRDLKKALEWADAAAKENPTAYYMFYLKAEIQAKLGDKAGAIRTANQSMELAKAANNNDYVRLNEKLIASEQ